MVKIDTAESVIEMYKKLPQEKKMFVLGIMQGVLIVTDPKQELFADKEKKTGQTQMSVLQKHFTQIRKYPQVQSTYIR